VTTLGKLVSARLTKTSFKRSQAGKVRLYFSFSPKSSKFAYVLTFKKGGKWIKVRSASSTGSFSGSYWMTVKQLFGSKPVKRGQYRLTLSASGNSKLLTFRVT
jgi:hypothetical protein